MELGAHEALTMGSNLWIVAGLDDSVWARKIDWYLNFQFSRASLHKRREISAELASTAESWEFDPPVIVSRLNAPLLVASVDALPNQMTVQISSSGTEWVKAAISVVESLKPASVRVFLPSGLDLATFSRAWGEARPQPKVMFTVVLDPGARSN